jgi:hypothetical protein
MTITEIQAANGGDVGIYLINDGGKSFIVKKYRDGFALATKENGFLPEIEGSPDLLSYIDAVRKEEHHSHPLSTD